MNISRRILVALMMMLALAAASSQPTTLAQSANLLTNPSFEDPFEPHLGSDGGGYVAHGWFPWFFNDAGDEFDGPEFKQATVDIDPVRVRSGFNAQQYFRDWAKHLAGVYQVVTVPAGSQLRFTVYGHAWSSFCDTKKLNNIKCDVHNSAYGDGINPMAMRIGIDPTGGTDPFSPHIVWSETRGVYDQYQQFAVEATAQGSRVTVFTLSAPEWPSAAINVYWDDASLTAAGGDPNFVAPPAATEDTTQEQAETSPGTTSQQPPSGNVNPAPPVASGGAYHEVLPGETLLGIAITYNVSLEDLMSLNNLVNPDSIFYGQQLLLPNSARSTDVLPDIAVDEVAESAAETETQEEAAAEQATNQLCLVLFEDLDLDGKRQPQEPLLPDGTFEVSGAISDTYTTDAENEPYCLTDLASGDYSVALEPPRGYAFAGLTEFPVTLSDGSRVSLSFGVIDSALLETIVESSEDQKIEPEAAAPSPGITPAVIGIGLGGVLLLVGGVTGIMLARRRWLLNREMREAEHNMPRIDTGQWQSILRDSGEDEQT